jgi:hypothetical protein
MTLVILKTKEGEPVTDIYGSSYPSELFVDRPFKILFENDDYVSIDAHDVVLKFYKNQIDRYL